MKRNRVSPFKVFILFILLSCGSASARDISFCNELIPVSDDFVANKLMNAIRNQIPNVTLATLRQRARIYFPYIEYCLKLYGLPLDFKYIPIVECGFRNVSSGAGARGFWQLMPDVARQYNLVVTPTMDERDDPAKATIAACRLINSYYKEIKKRINTSSYVLTAAAYNFGIGNVMKTVSRQGNDYFRMSLNAETAEYVYRIIAVKELFEHPELYMSGFGTNIFKSTGTPESATTTKVDALATNPTKEVDQDFAEIEIKVNKPGEEAIQPKVKSVYVTAKVVSNGKDFQDGGLLTIVLNEDLVLSGSINRKGDHIKGVGWIIDDRVFVDLGYGHEVELMDKLRTKGLSLEDASANNEYVVLRTEVPDED